MIRRLALVVGGVLVVALAQVSVALADSAQPTVLTPAFQDIVITKDQKQATFVLKLRNDSDTMINFRLSALDFKSLNETGGVAFVGENPSRLEQKYGLASWLILEKSAISVPGHDTADVRVTIDNRESLSPGGHYGAVLLTRVSDTDQNQDKTRVQVNQVLTSLILVRKTGGEVYGLRLPSPPKISQWWSLPGQVNLRFQNTGNVHVVPRGTIKLIDPLGRVVMKGIINSESAPILPESFRRYTVPLESLIMASVPGWYREVVSYRYDGSDTVIVKNTGFLWVNLPGLALITVVLIWLVVSILLLVRWVRNRF